MLEQTILRLILENAATLDKTEELSRIRDETIARLKSECGELDEAAHGWRDRAKKAEQELAASRASEENYRRLMVEFQEKADAATASAVSAERQRDSLREEHDGRLSRIAKLHTDLENLRDSYNDACRARSYAEATVAELRRGKPDPLSADVIKDQQNQIAGLTEKLTACEQARDNALADVANYQTALAAERRTRVIVDAVAEGQESALKRQDFLLKRWRESFPHSVGIVEGATAKPEPTVEKLTASERSVLLDAFLRAGIDVATKPGTITWFRVFPQPSQPVSSAPEGEPHRD